MKTNKITFAFILISALALFPLLTGCEALDSYVQKRGTPVATNYFPVVTVHTVTNTVTVTNTIPALVDPATGQELTPPRVDVATAPVQLQFIVTNLQPVIEYAPPAATTNALTAIGQTGSLLGIPGADLAASGITALLGLVYGWSNRRRAQRAQGKVNEMETVSVVLVQNVEVMKKLALDFATQLGKNTPGFAAQVNEWANDALLGAQTMAGVEGLIRSLVQKHTGDTRMDAGIYPTPAAPAVPPAAPKPPTT